MFVDPDKPLPPAGVKDDTLGSVLDAIINISNARSEVQKDAVEFEKVTTQALIDANKKIDRFDTEVQTALAAHTNKKGAVHGETKETVGLEKKENWRPATLNEHEAGQSKNTFVVPIGLHMLVKKFLTIDPTNYLRSRIFPIASGGQLGNVPQWPFNWKEGEVVESFEDPMTFFTDTPWEFSSDQGVRIYPAMNGSDVLTQHVADPGRVKRAVTPWGGTDVRVYNNTLDIRRTRPGVLRGESNDEPFGELIKGSSHLFDRHSVFYAENGKIGTRAFNKVRLPFDKLNRENFNDNWSGIIEAREETIYNIYTSFKKGNIGGHGEGIYLVVEMDLFNYTQNGIVVKDGPGRPAETIATVQDRFNTFSWQMQNAKFKVMDRGPGTPTGFCMNIKDILSFTDAQREEFWNGLEREQVTKIAFTWSNRLNGDFSIRIPMGFYNKNRTAYNNFYMDLGFHVLENKPGLSATISVRPLRDIDTNIQTLDANFDVKPTGRFITYGPNVANNVFHPLVFNGVFESNGGHIKTYTFYNRQYVGFYQHDVKGVGDWIAKGEAIQPNLVKYYYGQMSTLNNDGMYGDHLRHIPLGIEGDTVYYLTHSRDWNQQYRNSIAHTQLDTAPIMLSDLGHPYGPWRNDLTWINPNNSRIPDFLVVNSETAVGFETNCMVFNSQNLFRGYTGYKYEPNNPNSTVTGENEVQLDDLILSHLARVGGGWSVNHKQLFYYKNRLYFFTQCLSENDWPADDYDCYYGWYDSAYVETDQYGRNTIKLNGTAESKATIKKMKVNTKASATRAWNDVQGRDGFNHTDVYMMLMNRTGNASKFQLMVNLAPHNNFYFEFELSIDEGLGTTNVIPNPNAIDPVFPYGPDGFKVDYDTVIAYGTKTPQRLHINFQSPVMLKKSMWSYRKTPGHYGVFAQSIGTEVVNGGLMNAVEGTDIYPVGSAVTIGGSNIIVKKPVSASEEQFKGNDELFVRMNGLDLEMYGLRNNPNGYEVEPNSGVAPCGFLKNSTFTHYDQDGWRNALLPVMDGYRMNFYGYGSSFPAFMGIYGSGVPINRFFLTDRPTTLSYDTAVGRVINVGNSPTVKIYVNNTLQSYDGSGSFTIPTSYTGVVDVSITSLMSLTWSKGLTRIKTIGNTVQSLSFAGSDSFAIDADLPVRITSLVGLFEGSRGVTYPGIENWNTSRVTDMANIFKDAVNFNQDISAWNIGKVTQLEGAFYGARAFNKPIGTWDTRNVITMSMMFKNAMAFNQDLSTWDTYSVVNMSMMFQGANKFKGNVSTWNVSSVNNFSSMFDMATEFNGNLSNWDVRSATNMYFMFARCEAFNSPLASWNVSNVVTFEGMFLQSPVFNKDISAWNVSRATNTQGMFSGAKAFGSTGGFTLSSWNMSNVIKAGSMFYNSGFNLPIDNWSFGENASLESMFSNCEFFNQNVSSWDMRNVKSIKSMFTSTKAFNKNITNWQLDSCTNIDFFLHASNFAGDLSGWKFNTSLPVTAVSTFGRMPNFVGNGLETWDVSGFVDMGSMCYQSPVFNPDVSAWNVGKVKSFIVMFSSCHAFNQDISGWDVSSGLYFSKMFENCELFNQNLNDWDMSKAVSVNSMFAGTKNFDGLIAAWNVGNVTRFDNMFDGAQKWNGDISEWDVSKGENFSVMFANTPMFNQDIGKWITTSATNMDEMFKNALVFNADLSTWDVSKVTTHKEFDTNTPAWVLPRPPFNP